MNRVLFFIGAAVVAAIVLLHPAAPPSAAPVAAAAWTSSVPDARAARRPARSPTQRALAYVAGEVVHPGVYPVAGEARVGDVLVAAGGTRPDADLLAVNLAAHVRDGDEIIVPQRGAALSARAARSHGAKRRRHGGATHGAAKRGRHGGVAAKNAPPVAEVDINSADAATLATIPGIGDGLAERIVAFRDENGPFASVDELLDVAGITEHRLDAMIPYVVAR